MGRLLLLNFIATTTGETFHFQSGCSIIARVLPMRAMASNTPPSRTACSHATPRRPCLKARLEHALFFLLAGASLLCTSAERAAHCLSIEYTPASAGLPSPQPWRLTRALVSRGLPTMNRPMPLHEKRIKGHDDHHCTTHSAIHYS